MDYFEILTLIETRQEKVIFQDSFTLISNLHRYLRVDSQWVEDLEPGKPEERYGRNGKYWIWKRDQDV